MEEKTGEFKFGWDEQSEKIALELIRRNSDYKDLVIKLKKARLALNKKEEVKIIK
jgi:hypothetical protein